MTIEELQNSLKATLAEFKTTNDSALAEAKAHGQTSAATAEKVDKLNVAIDTLKSQLNTLSNNFSDKLSALSIGGAGGGISAAERTKLLASFRAATKRNEATLDQMDAYAKAFDAFIRVGDLNALTPEFRNAMSVGYEQGGGFWVPPDKSGPIQKKVFDTSPMRQICTVQTISTDALEGVIDNDEATTGWVSEKQSRPETKTPDIGKYRIEVYEQYANPRITQQLLDDSQYDVEAWLRDKVADKMARTENAAFINANGSGKPRGLLDYSITATTDATRAWNVMQYVPTGSAGAFATTNPADALLDLIYALKPGYRAGAVFIAARQTLGALRKLKDGQGNYLVGNTFSNGAFIETIFGFPVVEADDMPAIANNSFSIAFGNFKAGYIIVDRQGIRVLVDPYTAKPYVQFYTTKRVGGGLVNGEAIKWLKFSAS